MHTFVPKQHRSKTTTANDTANVIVIAKSKRKQDRGDHHPLKENHERNVTIVALLEAKRNIHIHGQIHVEREKKTHRYYSSDSSHIDDSSNRSESSNDERRKRRRREKHKRRKHHYSKRKERR